MLTLTAFGLFCGTGRMLSKGCSTAVAALCLILVLSASCLAAELDLSAMYSQRPAVLTAAAATVDISGLYARRPLTTAFPVDVSSLRRRPPEPVSERAAPAAPVVKPPPVTTSAAQALPQLLPAASYCVGPGCGHQIHPQLPPKRARGLFGRRR